MSKADPIVGTYRITHMDQWDQDFVDAEVPGYIRFDPDGTGEFQFGYVHGQMTVEFTERNGKPAVEWSWEGNDEMDPDSGRGWAVLQDDGTVKGKLFFHGGDSSGFTAEKKDTGSQTPKSGRTVRVINAKTGKPIEVEVEKLRSGPIRNPELPPELLDRIREVHAAVKDLIGTSLEEFEITFMRDSDAEDEVALWERIVVGMRLVRRAMPNVERKVILKTLLGYSMGSLTKAEKADPQVQKIIRIAEGR